jgi:hypothetical protein
VPKEPLNIENLKPFNPRTIRVNSFKILTIRIKQEWEQLVKAAPIRLWQIALSSTSGYVYYGWLILHLRIACATHFCIFQPFAVGHRLLQFCLPTIPWVFLAVYLPG